MYAKRFDIGIYYIFHSFIFLKGKQFQGIREFVYLTQANTKHKERQFMKQITEKLFYSMRKCPLGYKRITLVLSDLNLVNYKRLEAIG